ncbi:MAG: M20/M25/M40 family metallo-hydrolase [Chitinivibrionales bacterium]|nr:M20/M25/M40 family metallo-hydrolase [Chitinivibrionales bacterium]MBD3355619.1 M20/M25/M40 family metallo-hydrolase [Chitinivibrionales bacterium]
MKELIDLTSDLIRFRSTADRPDEIRRCIDFIAAYLDKHDIGFKRFEYEGVPSIAALPRDKEAEILLLTHIDVVAGDPEQFEPFEREGRLYGRGSIDDKYAAALSLLLLKNHVERRRAKGGDQSALPFGILITGDEEVGGFKGAKKALAEISARFCIAIDGGCVERIITKEKGMLVLRLTAKGRAAHGAYLWKGENAIEKLIDDAVKIRSLFTDNAEGHWHKTCNLGIISGGVAHNQVPDRAEAVFNIRYTENDDVDGLIAEVRGLVESEVAVEIKEPVFTGGTTKYLELLRRASPESLVSFTHGASDARFLSEYGIDGVVWGANGDESAHGPDEHLNVADGAKLYKYLDAFLSTVEENKEVRED